MKFTWFFFPIFAVFKPTVRLFLEVFYSTMTKIEQKEAVKPCWKRVIFFFFSIVES